MRDFRQLSVWEKSHQLALTIYRVTESFPADERFGLTSQLSRAAASIPTNIAEGCGRHTDRELAQFMQIAMGSASEVEYQILLAHDLSYITNETYTQLNRHTIEVKKMLASFLKRLRSG
ncbi:MAG: four helix bundle protein [Chloroflexota bacterium]